MLRRLKRDVLGQLPPKRRQRVLLEKLDQAAAKELRGKMREVGGVEAAAKLVLDGRAVGNRSVSLSEGESSSSVSPLGGTGPELFQLTSRAKLGAVQEYVEYLVHADCRFLLFAHHIFVLDALQETLEKHKVRFIRIDGGTGGKRREELVKEFQNCEQVRVALLSITACGQGFNLQCCSTVVFAELHWTPGVLLQAEDRTHRIGQVNAVNIHYLIARETIDESMYNILERKHQDISVLLDGREQSLGAGKAVGGMGQFSTTARDACAAPVHGPH
eukprot:gnl/TRDRNA2_/TRDRNA2_151050_c0_seq1.p1 gnl/TRDRNA2_/TRDRNA2_151050_c0~~gnl/TRDRNA2_/TRDRNA2_151050_c0_seq1.p1  ORF type:complete len:274 (-),score=57.18 gnl/TRDRNA2_/TRDRNA2_151050_c0_seq1:164-985(-)